MQHSFLKMAGVSSEEEFYNKYPTEEHFFKAFPKAKIKADFGASMNSCKDQFGNAIPCGPHEQAGSQLPNMQEAILRRSYSTGDSSDTRKGQAEGGMKNRSMGRDTSDTPQEHTPINWANTFAEGLMAIDAFIPQDKPHRRYLRPEDSQTYNAAPYGQPSQALAEMGASIPGITGQFYGKTQSFNKSKKKDSGDTLSGGCKDASGKSIPCPGVGIPTTSNSLVLYNNQLLKNKFYKNNKNYFKSTSSTTNKDIPYIINDLDRVKNNHPISANSDTFPTTITKEEAQKRYGKVSTNVYSSPDILMKGVDSFFNPAAPPSYFSDVIKPKKWQSYGSTYGDASDVPIYDAIAIKPAAMKTPADWDYMKKTYGKKVIAKPEVKRLNNLQVYHDNPPEAMGWYNAPRQVDLNAPQQPTNYGVNYKGQNKYFQNVQGFNNFVDAVGQPNTKEVAGDNSNAKAAYYEDGGQIPYLDKTGMHYPDLLKYFDEAGNGVDPTLRENIDSLYNENRRILRQKKQDKITGMRPGIDYNNGGLIPMANNGLQVEGNQIEQLSPHTAIFNGNSHEQGGIQGQFGNQRFEAEGGEPIFLDKAGNAVIAGNLKNPVTNRLFKNDAKILADKEMKAQKYIDLGTDLINISDPKNKWDKLAFNSGIAMQTGGAMKQKQLADQKEHLSLLQKMELMQLPDSNKARNGKVLYADNGVNMPPDDEWIRKILEFESKHGSANGTGLSNFGYNSRNPKSIEEAIKFFKQDYLPKVQQYPEGVRERVADYIYNTGRNPNDLLLYAAGKTDLNTINSAGSNNDLWNNNKADVEKMYSSPDFLSKLDAARNNIYKTTHQINGQPNPAYEKSWKDRVNIFNTIQSSPTNEITPIDNHDPRAKFDQLKVIALHDLQAKYPGSKVDVVYNKLGTTRTQGQQADIASRKGTLSRGFSLHNIDAARDLNFIVDGKTLPMSHPAYTEILIPDAKNLGLHTIGKKDPVHVSLAQEGGQSTAANFFKQYPDAKNWSETKNYFQSIEPLVKSGKIDKWNQKAYNAYANTNINTPTQNPQSTGAVTSTLQPGEQLQGENIVPLHENTQLPSYKFPDYKEAYNPQTVQGSDYEPNFHQVDPFTKKSNTKGLSFPQVAPELYTLATNREEPVKAQLYNPDLYNPYQVSFQDRINQNTSNFRGVENIVGNNPSALATLAGQEYQANNTVQAEEFRTNQAISNDITNKNISLINETKGKNLGILDQQYVRQSQAKANTNNWNYQALQSVAGKEAQNNLENKTLQVYENLYPHFSYNKDYKLGLDPNAPGGAEYINTPEFQALPATTKQQYLDLKARGVLLDNQVKEEKLKASKLPKFTNGAILKKYNAK